VSLHGDFYNGIKYAGVMLKQHSMDSSTASIEFRSEKTVTAWGPNRFPIFFGEEPRSKGPMKFERTPNIPAIAGDSLAYGVACLQLLDSSLEV
jgi:hypothetical protein